MTKSTITREQLEEWVTQFDEDGGCDATNRKLEAIIRQSLAAMDSEPVAEVLSNHPGNDTSTIDRALPVGTQLYRHAQPASVVPNEIKHRIGGLDWGWEGEFNRGWNACRAAMLQAGTLTNEGTKQAWTGIPDIDNAINMLDRIDTLESCDDDRIEAVKTVLRGLAGNSPVIPDGYVMVPVEPTKEILDEFDSIIDYGVEDSVDAWHRLLAAAPQSPGSEPAKDDRDHQLCRRCNDGIRGGCSSCAYNVR
ncbi:hypothetical protein ABKS13_15225 [Klebsiella pneumoniae]|uniref:hypothetical protein n=1 Tax=Klebsiella pneumoniae TaxID=573 RepID=UPI0032AE99D7